MGQCTGCLKYILFVFNFAMWLLGCSLLAVGIWMKMDDSAAHTVEGFTAVENEEYKISYSTVGDEDVTGTIAWLFIVFGAVILAVTFIGCCGAVRESACLLGVYAISLFVLMLVLIGIGTWAYMKSDNVYEDEELRNKIDTKTHGVLIDAMDNYYEDDFMKDVEKKFDCCGYGDIKNFKKFGYNTEQHLPLGELPCLSVRPGYETKIRCWEEYNGYVADEIRDFLYNRYIVIVGVSFGVAVCMALGLVFTILLCCIFKRTTTLSVN